MTHCPRGSKSANMEYLAETRSLIPGTYRQKPRVLIILVLGPLGCDFLYVGSSTFEVTHASAQAATLLMETISILG